MQSLPVTLRAAAVAAAATATKFYAIVDADAAGPELWGGGSNVDEAVEEAWDELERCKNETPERMPSEVYRFTASAANCHSVHDLFTFIEFLDVAFAKEDFPAELAEEVEAHALPLDLPSEVTWSDPEDD